MTSYQRILIVVPNGHMGGLLERAAFLAQRQHSDMLAVHVIDTRSGFEPDGPAACLPEESAARQVPRLRQMLDQQLTRHNLAWVPSEILWGEPPAKLESVIRRWRPDLILACSDSLPKGIAAGIDTLILPCQRPLSRAYQRLQQMIPHHA